MHKFIYEDTENYIEFRLKEDSSLPELLAQFELYVKAVGFQPKGNLDFVSEEESYAQKVNHILEGMKDADSANVKWANGWQPIEALTHEHRDGRWILFESVEGVPELLKWVDLCGWVNFQETGGYHNEKLFYRFLPVPPLPAMGMSQDE